MFEVTNKTTTRVPLSAYGHVFMVPNRFNVKYMAVDRSGEVWVFDHKPNYDRSCDCWCARDSECSECELVGVVEYVGTPADSLVVMKCL